MSATVFQAMGGLGIFLLGMVVMTDGLKGLAGNMLRLKLTRFTHDPVSGAISGAATTAILQSSSATTVAAIGFVSAGLLTFPQALGIIFGANIGTTITGWLVALVGFKFKLATIVSPLVLLGILMRLFGRGKIASAGMAIAGFSLIFIAITLLQNVMQGLEGIITTNDFPADTISGRLKLVAMGMAITLITQSSSAGVATALTALYVGTISFPQAMALVIGMDIATAIKAIIASIGGSADTRRTGISHVIYNLYSGTVAFMLLTPYTLLLDLINPDIIQHNAELALVGFHSSFNILCVLLILPFTNHFAGLIYKLIPEEESSFTTRLEQSLLNEPGIALEAVRKTLHEEVHALYDYIRRLILKRSHASISFVQMMQSELDITHDYVDQIHLAPKDGAHWTALLSSIHTLDHLQRLHERCEEDIDRLEAALSNIHLQEYCERLAHDIDQILTSMDNSKWDDAVKRSEASTNYFNSHSFRLRDQVMADVATGKMTVPDGTDSLEGIRWLERVSKHIYRITFYMHELHSKQLHN
ncbi:MAG TPA: Na/Pi symporter [Gammaproteobacteria bacterium]|jgi:phosphate:Na+ symporter